MVAHDRESDPRQLVGERHRDQLEGLGLHQLAHPSSQGVVMAFAIVQDGVGADDQQLAQIAVACREPSWLENMELCGKEAI